MCDQACSREEVLRDWIAGRLPVEAAKVLLAHLERCPRCQAKLETVSAVGGDPLIDGLRQPRLRDELLDEPQFQEAVARAKAISDVAIKPNQAGAVRALRPEIEGALGEYRILEKLGEGGMGTVYKALHTRLDRQVALKVLSVGTEVNERVIARFEREMKAVGGLDHPHIVRALDAREVDGTRFLALEYIDGVDLSRLVRQRGPLPVAEACRLVRQAAEGLQYAHQHDLIHRDVKPSNLMVDGAGQLRILDLGLARLWPTEPGGGETTRFGQTMGTAEYMAPEQAWDSRSVDARADIYGLGCTLYCLLMGRPPYTGQTDFQILTAHRESPTPSLNAQRNDVPEALDRVFRRMVAKIPAKRHASMAEVIEDLDRCLASLATGDLGASCLLSADRGESQDQGAAALIAQGPPGQPSASPRPTRKKWSVIASLVTGAIALLILHAGLMLQPKTPVGSLILSVDPEDAQVVVDDRKLSITPHGDGEPTEIPLAEGEHQLVVSKGGFQTRSESFRIKSGGHQVVNIKLVPLAAPMDSETVEAATIVLGDCGTLQSFRKISDIEGNFTGLLADRDFFGGSLANLGDLDGNGVTDLAVGAYGDNDGGTDRGAVWLLFLNADRTVKAQRKISAAAGNFTGALGDGDLFGKSAANVGDLDGDGVTDLAVGAPGDNEGGTDRGAVWILYLRADGAIKSHQKINGARGDFTGTLDDGDCFGQSLTNVGDFNSDGVTDLAVGAILDDDGGTDRGAIWMLFLAADGTVQAHRKISGAEGSVSEMLNYEDFFGCAVANVGDIDGDGVTELAVGAMLDDEGGSGHGAVWILFPGADGTIKAHRKISAVHGNFTRSLHEWDALGSSIANAGDLDRDGLVELAVGACGDNDGGTDRGAVWILSLATSHDQREVDDRRSQPPNAGAWETILPAGTPAPAVAPFLPEQAQQQ